MTKEPEMTSEFVNRPACAVDVSSEVKKIPLFKVFMPKSVMGPLKKTLMSGYIAQGPRVLEFEEKLKDFLGVKNILTVDAGTHALELALRLAGVDEGDEVISSPLTCVATNMPVMARGAKIRWSDVLVDTGNIDPESIERLITPRTKAILYVHWAGNPANIDRINEIAKKHNIKVIEDAAHAFGAGYKGKRIGNHSDFVMYSFQAIKHMTTGDGGALVCKDEEDHKRGRALRWFGLDRTAIKEELRWYYDIKEWGYKFNMNDIDATIGLEHLKYTEKILKVCRWNGNYYNKNLSKVKGIRVLRQEDGASSAYWLYTLLAERRDEFIEYLKKKGIDNSIVHTRNDVYTCFKDFKDDLPRPGLEEFTSKYVSIPSCWWVKKEDAKYIVDSIKAFYER
ncbi:MAG: DegT/DnrJ/EryC1/StrS family aminotransferase [Candidatus Woesearchaeota archaeon]|nr:DegT/DnrJ/EryC1/StrS family aminotransferase [Candidatus Woesearchaeota archaeon]